MLYKTILTFSNIQIKFYTYCNKSLKSQCVCRKCFFTGYKQNYAL